MRTYMPESFSKTAFNKITLVKIVISVLIIGLGALVGYLIFDSQARENLVKFTPLGSLLSLTDPNATLNCKQYQPLPKDFDPKKAKYPKLAWPNNKVGVYAYAETKSLESASKLVNSNGGDWGYVLIPFNIDETSGNYRQVWNERLAFMCQKHLIPILQLFDSGKIPTNAKTVKAAEFLSSLNWPVKTKFITVYNETNAAEYWDNKIDPEGYAKVLDKTITEFKKRDNDFFIMNGALNTSAVKEKIKTDLGVETEYIEASDYMDRMDLAVPGIFKKLDGWAAHCYPNPHYLGKPTDIRPSDRPEFEDYRGTISSYKYDLTLLKKFGADELPVFITETGWPHQEGADFKSEYLPASVVSNYYKTTFERIYMPDPQVVAVTPFIIRLDGGLDNFAFITKNDKTFPQFDVIYNLPKTAGRPPLN